jgi:outer membrane protein, multidrug efflux system
MHGSKEVTEMHRWLAAAAPIFLLNACMMGPNYTRPETPSGDSWRMAPATAESIANLPWWELLKDQELQKLVRVALQENQDMRVAVASVEQFQAQLVIAKFDLAPSLGYSGTAFTYHNTRNAIGIPGVGAIPGPSTNTGGFDLSYANATGGVKWEADLWGRIRRSIEATRAQLLSRAENQRAVILDLVSNVADAYFDLRTLDLQVDITKRTLKTWEESVRISQIKLQQGTIPKLDLDRFEAERANAAAQLADLERQVVQKENQISLILGRRTGPGCGDREYWSCSGRALSATRPHGYRGSCRLRRHLDRVTGSVRDIPRRRRLERSSAQRDGAGLPSGCHRSADEAGLGPV